MLTTLVRRQKYNQDNMDLNFLRGKLLMQELNLLKKPPDNVKLEGNINRQIQLKKVETILIYVIH